MEKAHDIGDRREFLIGEIYKAALGAAPISNALQGLAELTRSDKAYWSSYDLQRDSGEIVGSFNVEKRFIDAYGAADAPRNAWLAKPRYFQAEGLIWRGSRIVPMHELLTSEFYARFLAPQEIHHTLHIVVSVERDRVAHIILTRRPFEPDYGDAEIDLARCFALHARKAAESQRMLARLRMVQSILSSIVDDAALGVVIVDPPQIVYTSDRCEKILTSLRARARSRGELVQREGDAGAIRSFFPRTVADAIYNHNYISTTRLIIEASDQSGRLLVQIKPCPFDRPSATGRQAGLAVVFYDLDQEVSVDEELLQTVYDLTASESRVCSLLAKGECVEELAEKLHITPNTARTHIKRIFGKTGATRQVELVKLIMNTTKLRRDSFISPSIGSHHEVGAAKPA